MTQPLPTVRVRVRPTTGAFTSARFCRQHGGIDPELGYEGVPNVAGRLELIGGGCPDCACVQLAAGTAVLAPEALDAQGKPVPLADLYEGAGPLERSLLDKLTAAADASGHADVQTVLRALRRAIARPGSADTRELVLALQMLLGPATEPVPPALVVPVEGVLEHTNSGVFRRVQRWIDPAA